MRTGSNIRQRADGRYEARYIKGHDKTGKAQYGYCYGKTYEEAEQKRSEALLEINRPKEMNLLILGAGSCGMEVYELAASVRMFGRIRFLDDNAKGELIIGACADLEQYVKKYPLAIPAIGNNEIRKKWMTELQDCGFIIPTFVHPSANVSHNCKIGAGTLVFAGATAGAASVIGQGCIIDSGAIIERKAKVEDWEWVKAGGIIKS